MPIISNKITLICLRRGNQQVRILQTRFVILHLLIDSTKNTKTHLFSVGLPEHKLFRYNHIRKRIFDPFVFFVVKISFLIERTVSGRVRVLILFYHTLDNTSIRRLNNVKSFVMFAYLSTTHVEVYFIYVQLIDRLLRNSRGCDVKDFVHFT